MTIYPFRGPLVRPSKENAELDERERKEDEDKGEDGRGGEESDEQASDTFAAEGDLSKKLEKALGGRATAQPKRAVETGISVLAIRAQKKK